MQLKPFGPDPAVYDEIFVGAPNWGNRMAPPVMPYLPGWQESDAVLYEKAFDGLKALTKDADIGDVIPVRDRQAAPPKGLPPEIADSVQIRLCLKYFGAAHMRSPFVFRSLGLLKARCVHSAILRARRKAIR